MITVLREMDIFGLNHICDGPNINFLYHNDLTHMSHDNFGDAITLSAPIHGTPSIMGMEPSNACILSWRAESETFRSVPPNIS